VNRYGGGGAAVSQVLARWVDPPVAPVIGILTWDNVAARFHAPVHHEAGTKLVFALPSEEDTAACPGPYSSVPWNSPVVEDVDRLGQGVGEFFVTRPRMCVSFYAVDEETGVASAPTSVVADAPLPTETLEVGAISLDHRAWPVFEAPVTGAQHGDHVVTATVAGSCPATVPSDLSWYSEQGWGSPIGPVPAEFEDIYGLYPRAHGANCAFFTVTDWFGPGDNTLPRGSGTRHGPVVMREFTDDGPPAPILSEPTWNATKQTFVVPSPG
jgi:hypothetical protein